MDLYDDALKKLTMYTTLKKNIRDNSIFGNIKIDIWFIMFYCF